MQLIMRKIITILILIFSIQISSAQTETRYISRFSTFENNNIEYLFADNVKFRETPDLQSNIIELLKIGTPIKILEKSEQTLEFDGINSNWYKISINDKVGYILGALISVDNFKSPKTNSSFKFQISQNEEKDFFLKVRVISNENFKEYKYKLIGEEFAFQFKDNNGLNNLDNIIIVDYIAEACGIENGRTYLFWNNSSLIKIADLSAMADGGIYSYDETFIFPIDINGIKDKIVYRKTTQTQEDEETNWVKETTETREYIWNGEILNPNIIEQND